MSKHRNDEPGLKGLYVEVRNNDVNRAMRKLKKMINNEGILQEMRERESFEKPSMTKKKARAAARKRWVKQQEKTKEI
jgi:small subunit ribosomal protein S21